MSMLLNSTRHIETFFQKEITRNFCKSWTKRVLTEHEFLNLVLVLDPESQQLSSVQIERRSYTELDRCRRTSNNCGRLWCTRKIYKFRAMCVRKSQQNKLSIHFDHNNSMKLKYMSLKVYLVYCWLVDLYSS